MRLNRPLALAATALVVASLSACGTSDATTEEAAAATTDGTFPVTVEHALGTTTVPAEPERVATVQWANQEVPLALGVVPVGMAAANFGDDDGDGVLPWVAERLDELDAPTPVLFDETDGIDFEAVADTRPDLILAPYSGLTQDDYDTLSEIAPVVAYPEGPWATPWRETIELSSTALGRKDEGDALIADLEQQIADTVGAHEGLAGTPTMFLTHVDEKDLSQVSFYTSHDTRTQFFTDLGLDTPGSVAKASEETEEFSQTVSAEQADTFADVELIVTYGGDDLVDTLEGDPLLSQIPAVANGAIVSLPGDAPFGTAANPTALSISWILDEYADALAEAAAAR